MAQDPQLSNLLKWSIENTVNGTSNETTNNAPSNSTEASQPARTPNPEALAALFGGKSDADLMRESMAALQSPELSLDNKLIAFDNMEQLIENIDNANNLGPLELWTPLVSFLSHEDADMRRMAAWCVGTAVQNNPQCQERALVCGAVKGLVKIVRDQDDKVRKKACYGISSEVRNFQSGLDEVLRAMAWDEKVDANDMDAVDGIMSKLRELGPVIG